ncbi:hypothetical protein D5039_10270 [Verminephrobacter aporrectodeae subsp. tuberculatae]|uniref:KDO2-lipid IV(A) lauroyltransferase n=1 Tax=Verminephrobacter aporrectodeae subsp. tuberculatae TaxID=1110392 RepID=A0ABT3KTE6_9BURK|nr:hypothetical protein [Verminephrobacter aporrectodeae]MCW5257295.1 hypothetical protein [Verminephrobacter aporrectodeae subsp. tuberculatae]MCW5321520.1 hypothetical protein [Verminephrobacter aporrectodeae subsp. tuberculatae]MCW8166426.1 hypothetical protein [Verminephrobacter aporrectodeae subsp. tuberculatae]MCW8170591.1 hypothetical protein [Verminephrobacter aporrectodeae subsp. tuberculatae]
MAAHAMIPDWRLRFAFPALGRMPCAKVWHLAALIGREPWPARRLTQQFLVQRFAQVFPGAGAPEHREWARAHLAMRAQETLDAAALHRLGQPGGPAIELTGWEHVAALMRQKQGFVLVLNHFDRLLTAPIALARKGLALNTLTMPILENPGLEAVQRDFLLRKVRSFTRIVRGQWRTSTQGMRPVHAGLRAGQAWVILADAWDPGFTRLRSHPFLGGQLHLPTGIERLAQSAGVPLLHATTYSRRPDRLQVVVESLPGDPAQAIDAVLRRLERDVRARPWAWWHWGQWEQMWSPCAAQLGGKA